MKQRIIKHISLPANVESIEVNVERKFLRSHRWLRFVKRFLNRISKKLLIGVCLLLFLLIIVCVLLYLSNVTIINTEKSSIIDVDYVLPIGNATDKDYYITRPNGRDDGGVARVMFAIASTRIDWALCYAVASAYFTNIPVIVTGYKKQNYNNTNKPSMFMHAVEQAGLQDSDVVIALDSDIMFTGLDYLPFIDKFIKLSPANLNELDAKAIRTGQMMAPSIYGTEGWCWTPQTLSFTWKECKAKYQHLESKHKKYVSSLTESAEKPFVNYNGNKLFYFNSGASINRVWAMRKVFAAFHKFLADNKPLDDKEWWEDQSVFAKLYLELRLWEIKEDYFRKSTNELRTMSNEYGLYAGLLGLDLKGELSVIGHLSLIKEMFELNTSTWKWGYIKKRQVIDAFAENKNWLLSKFYKKAKNKYLFTLRKLTRSYSNVESITVVPPLLSVVPRHINGKDQPAERVFPLMMHFAGGLKFERENAALSYMQWSLPMMFDEEEWKRGKQYAMSMPIELWTDNDEKLRLRYGDVCDMHPYNGAKVLFSLN